MKLEKMLQRHPVFSCLDREDREIIARGAISKKYQEGEWIAHRGQDWPYFFLVKNGIVQALKESAEGRSLLVVELAEGEIFWGLSFFIAEARMPVALVAKERTDLFLWTLGDLKPVLFQNGQMSWELARLMILKMQYASEILNEFAFQPVPSRLSRLLLDHFEDAMGDYVSRDMTLEEMAARIGSTREMVCRHLYQLADQGAIEINRTELKVLDQDLLRQFARKEK